MFKRSRQLIQKLWRAEEGVALAYVVAFLFLLVGVAALAIDISHAYANRQRMQSAADAAAMSGAIALAFGEDMVTNGQAAAGSSGWPTDSNNIDVTIRQANVPAGYTGGVEAIVQQPMGTSFSQVFRVGEVAVAARAVAAIPTMSYCMIALSTTAKSAFSIQGNSTVGNPNCAMASNSTQTGKTNGGFNIQGNATVNAPVRSSGSISEPGNPTVYSKPPFPKEGATAVADPYASNAWIKSLPTSIPPTSPTNLCTQKTIPAANVVNQGDTVTGGKTICGLKLTGGATTLQNGTYYIYPTSSGANANAVSISGSATQLVIKNAIVFVYGQMTATAGTISTTSSTLVLYGDSNISATVQLSAPTSGANSGFALVSPIAVNVSITGGSNSSLTGAIYLPKGAISFNGSFTSKCAQLIANTISISGTISLNYDGTCGGKDARDTGVISLIQ